MTEAAPVGKVDSFAHVLAPDAATGAAITVGSAGLARSPVAIARQRTVVGQEIVPTDVTVAGAEGSVSAVIVGIHDGLPARCIRVAVEPEDARGRTRAEVGQLAGGRGRAGDRVRVR